MKMLRVSNAQITVMDLTLWQWEAQAQAMSWTLHCGNAKHKNKKCNGLDRQWQAQALSWT
jgi:hypothetical protein